MRARSVEALLALARWPNAALAALGVVFGAWWAGSGPAAGAGAPGVVPRVALAALGAVALTVAANAWNDAADVEIDRLAHPARPLPSGRVTRRAACWFAAAGAVAGIALTAASARPLGALSVLVVALMFAYSPWLKRAGAPGNVVVAVLASLPFLYGAWAVGRPNAALVLVAVAIPLHLAREVAKDLDDAAADAAAARRTLPVRAGPRVARAVLAAACVAFLLLLLPFAAARPHFAAAALPAVALVAYAVTAALRGRRGSPLVFKLAMVCAMAAFLTARP